MSKDLVLKFFFCFHTTKKIFLPNFYRLANHETFSHTVPDSVGTLNTLTSDRNRGVSYQNNRIACGFARA